MTQTIQQTNVQVKHQLWSRMKEASVEKCFHDWILSGTHQMVGKSVECHLKADRMDWALFSSCCFSPAERLVNSDLCGSSACSDTLSSVLHYTQSLGPARCSTVFHSQLSQLCSGTVFMKCIYTLLRATGACRLHVLYLISSYQNSSLCKHKMHQDNTFVSRSKMNWAELGPTASLFSHHSWIRSHHHTTGSNDGC